MRLWIVTWMALVACLIEPFAMRCGARETPNATPSLPPRIKTKANLELTLSWSPSPSPGVASYNLCWGTASGVYTHTNKYPNNMSNILISDLEVTSNQVIFFAVQAVASNGVISDFSNEDSTNIVLSSLPG